MELLEHSYNAYLRELDRRDQLRRALALPMGLTVVLAGTWYSLVGRFAWLGAREELVLAFAGLVALGLIVLAAGALFLVLSHVGYVYAYVPTATEILEYSDKLMDYYQVSTRDDAQVKADIDELLTTEFAQNAHENAMNTKSKYLHNASVRLVASIGCLVAAGAVELFARVGEHV